MAIFPPKHIEETLTNLSAQGLLRNLHHQTPNSADFTSNDYLGLAKLAIASSPLPEGTHGATGSRLLSGNSRQIELLEQEIANFHGAQSALLFNSGYDANVGLFGSIPNRHDVVLHDEFIHASIIDGIRLSLATRMHFKHNNAEDFAEKLEKIPAETNVYIALESIYSMDGDIAPLKPILILASMRPNTWVFVDEAHSVGLFGEKGQGLIHSLGLLEDCLAIVYTYGKALGSHGAAICCSASLRHYLINKARPLIYSTALPPHSVHRLHSVYKHLGTPSYETSLSTLEHNIHYWNSLARPFQKYSVSSNLHPIQHIIFGDNQSARTKAAVLNKKGFYVRPILSPTVPKGSERIRVCLHAYNTESEIKNLFEAL